ncbi:uncharacterized protein LOC112589130 [Harpegnathos saltator]|uniref:uncharacterized protein LOC112589130 n=1 Tax=Harpegnathos saltator TaxID=610380 RepID=UPI000DBEE2D3|nr:uncharacterized protein LOC112589130 [Harpegnathos saltator]
MDTYFEGRNLAFNREGGVQGRRAMERGVPQGRGAPPETQVLVDGIRIRVGPTIKYLGLTLDGRWDFGPHFRDRAPRDLAARLNVCREGQKRLRQTLRPMMVKMTRSYSTVSYMAATTLAGFPPVELIAEERRILYWRIKELHEGEGLRAGDVRALKSQAVARTHTMWADKLSDPRRYGPETAEAVRPCLPEFAGRRGCGLSFHQVQILTGHGCIGKYLHRIGKEPTTRCHYCHVLMDTALHILADLMAKARQQIDLKEVGLEPSQFLG